MTKMDLLTCVYFSKFASVGKFNVEYPGDSLMHLPSERFRAKRRDWHVL